MKHTIEQLLKHALITLQKSGEIPSADLDIDIKVERTKDSVHGDYAQ